MPSFRQTALPISRTKATRDLPLGAMENLEVFLVALFVSVALLNAVASWLDLPYPIVLVVGGLVLAVVPGVPRSTRGRPRADDLPPPLLYSAAFFSDLRPTSRTSGRSP